MPSAVSSEKIGSGIYVKSFDHDPGATTAVLASPDGGTTIRYLDLKEYHTVSVMAKPNIVAAGGLTKLELVASATTSFSSVTSIKDSGTVAADALDDNVFLECTASEVAQLGSTLRYIAARLTHATNTDESTVTYVAVPVRSYTGLTATSIT
jgi:hypothetical protein